MRRLLFTNGTLVDGTGAPPTPGDLLVEGDRIAAIGKFEAPAEASIVDSTGLTIAPGFIDAHSHSDLQVLEGRMEKILQGVTTEVVGNCGFSTFPAAADRTPLHSFANGILCGDDRWGWASARDYLAAVERSQRVLNVASLVGHGTLRIAVAGNRLGALTERELDGMEGQLSQALSQGACGFSTGLMYAPGASAPPAELERLCRVVARHDKIYTTHMRSYSTELLEAIDEQIGLAERTGCRLQISHLQAVGPANWSRQARALERIESARQRGVDVAFDCYPYIAGSTVLTQLLPQEALAGGVDGMLARLADPAQRARIKADMLATIAQRWIDIYISAVGSPANQAAVGQNIAMLAEARGSEPADVILDLLVEERGEVNMVAFNQSEENLKLTLTHPLSIIISDGFYVKGRPHPRLHGTFPLLLGEFCRKRGWLTLAEAVHKVTQSPAQRFGIEKRGTLAPGSFADLVVFDAGKIDSPATYDNPELAPAGIVHVYRNGQPVLN